MSNFFLFSMQNIDFGKLFNTEFNEFNTEFGIMCWNFAPPTNATTCTRNVCMYVFCTHTNEGHICDMKSIDFARALILPILICVFFFQLFTVNFIGHLRFVQSHNKEIVVTFYRGIKVKHTHTHMQSAVFGPRAALTAKFELAPQSNGIANNGSQHNTMKCQQIPENRSQMSNECQPK